jgi:phosphoenolpyruvate carboxykinase (GTP)
MHGVYIGATLGSETTAAATGAGGRRPPRSDGHASVHWLQHPRLPRALVPHAQAHERLPAHFSRQLVPQRTPTGKFIWPGFGENMRVLKWIHRPLPRPSLRRRNAIGLDAAPKDIDLEGLPISMRTTRGDSDGGMTK